MAYRNYHPSNGFHVSQDGNGDYLTINAASAAIIAAGLTNISIFIHDGIYTENITLATGCDYIAFVADESEPNVTINGTCSFSVAGTVSLSGIRLKTNSASFLSLTGSAISIVNLNSCFLNCSNATGITYSTTNAASTINIVNCQGNIGTTGIRLYNMTSTGTLNLTGSQITNLGLSILSSINSAGAVALYNSLMNIPFSCSASGIFGATNSYIDTSGTNAIAVTTAGTGISGINNTFVGSGSGSCISIGTGTTLALYNSVISSTNTNAVTGAGTINYSGISFAKSSSTINVTTQPIAGTLQGSKNTAPTGGFLGEQITSGLVTGVSLSNNSALTVASINLTAGIWDVSGICYCSFGGVATAFEVSIGTTNNTVTGQNGDTQNQLVATLTSTNQTLVVPTVRATLTATTTYYLVALVLFSTSTATAAGRISATRVG